MLDNFYRPNDVPNKTAKNAQRHEVFVMCCYDKQL